jgi:hypothetical protein
MIFYIKSAIYELVKILASTVIGFNRSNLKSAGKHAISSCARALIPNFAKKEGSSSAPARKGLPSD